MDFSFEPKVTREFLLSENNEETYMSYYLGIPVDKGLYVSPLRSDHHKTCGFLEVNLADFTLKILLLGNALPLKML